MDAVLNSMKMLILQSKSPSSLLPHVLLFQFSTSQPCSRNLCARLFFLTSDFLGLKNCLVKLTFPFFLTTGKGPANYKDYAGGTYVALLAYMGYIRPNYELTVERLAKVIDTIACDGGLPASTGPDWTVWALDKFAAGVKLIDDNMDRTTPGLGIDWTWVNTEAP